MENTKALQNLIAKRFISRTDVKARQWRTDDGKVGYSPTEGEGWSRDAIRAHIDGEVTYGHYVSSPENTCKLVTFDIDICTTGKVPILEYNVFESDFDHSLESNWTDSSALDIWYARSDPRRTWIKHSLRMAAHRIASILEELLELPTAVAYTGNKGLHVYGFFPAHVPLETAFEAGAIVMSQLNYTATLGQNFWQIPQGEPPVRDTALTIEVFPKQTKLTGKGYGNLVRLPLGKNLKSPKQPAFFVDMCAPMALLEPVDPVFALTSKSVFERHGGPDSDF